MSFEEFNLYEKSSIGYTCNNCFALDLGAQPYTVSNGLSRMMQTKKIYSTHKIIENMVNMELATLFQEDIDLAESYLSKVLEKEGMIAILQEHCMITYKEAEARLMETESKNNKTMFAKLLKKHSKDLQET